MRKRTLIGLLLLCVFFQTTPVMADSSPPYVEPGDCPIEVPADADIECGYLVVPENYDQPDGRIIRMPYIIIHSDHPEESPLLFTEGGPGGDSLRAVRWFVQSSFIQDRDVIIFQQRGNHYTDPSLECTIDELFDPKTISSPCKEKFISAGIDLTQYHTAVIAQDIESFRIALGYESWNLMGVSYSTRVMQVLMDRYPEGIRSVILQSVSPLHETRYQHDPEHTYRALRVMFEDCASNPDCAEAYPDLEERFFALVGDLNLDSIKLELVNPADGSPYPYEVSGRTLIGWMAGRAFYLPAYPPYPIAYYPLLIDQLDSGETASLTSWAQNELYNEIFDPGFIAFGLYFAVNCQNDASSVTLDQIQTQAYTYPQMGGYYRHQGEWDLCQLWDLPAAPPLTEGPIVSQIPTLVLAGSYDPITPPEWSRVVADNLENAYYVEFQSLGHSLDVDSVCPNMIKQDFLLDPWSEPDSSCMVTVPSIKYILPSDTLPAKGFSQSIEDIDYGVPERGVPFFEVVTYTSNLIFLIEVLVFLGLSVIIAVGRSNRKEKSLSMGYRTHIKAALTALLSIGVIVLLSLINQKSSDQLLSIFGLVRSTPLTTALGLVVLAQMLAAVILAVGAIRAWKKNESTLLNRIYLTIVSLAAVTFWPFFFRWDLVRILF